MNVEIPFAYNVGFVKRGHRVPMGAVAATRSTFHLRETEDAELVFSVGHGLETDSCRFGLLDGRPPKTWRVDGAYYVEACRLADFADVVTATGWAGKRNPLNVHTQDVLPFLDGREAMEKTVVTHDQVVEREGALRQWNDDGGRAKAAMMQRRLNEMLIVDGFVCVRVSEPTIVVSEEFGEHPHIAVAVIEMDPAHSSEFPLPRDVGYGGRRFRVDRKEEACALARLLAETAGGIEVVDHVQGTTFPAGDALAFCEEAEAIERTASDTFHRLAPSVSLMPRPVASAWYELRDAIDASLGGKATVRMIESLRAMQVALRDPAVSAWVSDRPTYYGVDNWRAGFRQEYREERDAAKEFAIIGVYLGDALARWDARPRHRDWIEMELAAPALRTKGYVARELTTKVDLDVAATSLHLDRDMFASCVGDGAHIVELAATDGRKALATIRTGPSGVELIEVVGQLGRPAGDDLQAAANEFVAHSALFAPVDDDEFDMLPSL